MVGWLVRSVGLVWYSRTVRSDGTVDTVQYGRSGMVGWYGRLVGLVGQSIGRYGTVGLVWYGWLVNHIQFSTFH